MRRRRDLTGWLLMAVLFIGAMALIFYILLMRAQHLGSMEQQRTDPQSYEAPLVASSQPVVMLHSGVDGVLVPHHLVIDPT